MKRDQSGSFVSSFLSGIAAGGGSGGLLPDALDDEGSLKSGLEASAESISDVGCVFDFVLLKALQNITHVLVRTHNTSEPHVRFWAIGGHWFHAVFRQLVFSKHMLASLLRHLTCVCPPSRWVLL